MSLWLFLGVLTLLSMAMVHAMVRFSEAWLAEDDRGDERQRWGVIYAGLWIAIGALLLVFIREVSPADEREKHLLIVVAAPLGWLAVHALLLWFGSALRRAKPAGRASRSRPVERVAREPEKAPVVEPPPASPSTLLQSVLGWVVPIGVTLLVIAIGENLPILHRLDAVLAPHRATLKVALIALLVAGFGLFMGGIINLLLHGRPGASDGQISLRELKEKWGDGTWRDSTRVKRFLVIIAAVLLAAGSGAALAIVFARPGLKLMAMLVVGYVVIRTIAGFRRA